MLNVMPRLQRGVTLVESLVSILVLAIGVAGLAWTQARLLAEGRQANARAIAVALAQDLLNRMQFNQPGVSAGGYQMNWGEMPGALNCQGSPCSASAMAQSDLAAWRAALAAQLPHGDATVFRSGSDARHVGIAISWVANEIDVAEADAPAYRAPFAITAATHGVDCPATQQCLVVHVRI